MENIQFRNTLNLRDFQSENQPIATFQVGHAKNKSSTKHLTTINEEEKSSPNQFKHETNREAEVIKTFESRKSNEIPKISVKTSENFLSQIPEETQPKPKKTVSLWDKARNIIKGVTSFQKLNRKIQLFGTSENNFDEKNPEKYLQKLKNIQGETEKPQEKIENTSKCSKILNFLSMFPVFEQENIMISIWNVIISLMMLYTAIIMPFVLCFLDTSSDVGWLIFDTIVDFSFLMDVLVNCNLAYYDEDNIQVKDRKKIMLNYLKSWFFIDLVTSFPQSLVQSKYSPQGNLIRITRVSKITRLIRVMRILKVSKFFKKAIIVQKIQEYFNINFGISRLLGFLFTTLLISHICGCLWYFLPRLYDESNNWVVQSNLQDETVFRLYLFSLYWSFSTLFTVGFGDIHAYNAVEYILSILWMLFGVGFYSFTIGTLSSILVNMDTRENILKYKLSVLNDFSKETNLPTVLKDKIKKILVYNSQKNIFSWMDKQEIFNELPANLKCEIANSMREGFLKDITFFAKKEDAFVAMIVPFLQPLNFQEKEPIYKKNEHPNSIYFITQGRVCFINDSNIPFKIMVKGSYFGEIEIIDKVNRTFGVIASEITDTLTLSKQIYENIIVKEYAEIDTEIKNLAFLRKERFSEAESNLSRILRNNKNQGIKNESPLNKENQEVMTLNKNDDKIHKGFIDNIDKSIQENGKNKEENFDDLIVLKKVENERNSDYLNLNNNHKTSQNHLNIDFNKESKIKEETDSKNLSQEESDSSCSDDSNSSNLDVKKNGGEKGENSLKSIEKRIEKYGKSQKKIMSQIEKMIDKIKKKEEN